MKAVANIFTLAYEYFTMSHQKSLLPFLVLTVFLAGCSTNHPTIGAHRGVGPAPARTDKIAIGLRPDASDEDAQLDRLLTAELKREGFNLVSPDEADYIFAYALEDDSTATYVPRRDFAVSSHPQTTRDIVASATPASPGFAKAPYGAAPSIGPTVIVHQSKGIGLYLYTNPKTHAGKFQLAWSGCIDSGQEISAARETLLIEHLLGHFGEDYVGTADLDGD